MRLKFSTSLKFLEEKTSGSFKAKPANVFFQMRGIESEGSRKSKKFERNIRKV